MINVAAIRMQQFGVQFYQASLTASDIDKLVRFEVLSYGESGQPPVRGGKKKVPSKVNWDLLERRIASSEKAYQRQIIRRKIDELVQYYEQCRQARDLPSIPGAVIISCDEKLTFEPVESGASVGRLKVPEREGILRAIDGQHRLLALHADIDHFGDEPFTVPAIIFDRVPEDHIVQMFVTINAKHTRLNASLANSFFSSCASGACATRPRPTPSSLISPCNGESSRSLRARTTSCAAARESLHSAYEFDRCDHDSCWC